MADSLNPSPGRDGDTRSPHPTEFLAHHICYLDNYYTLQSWDTDAVVFTSTEIGEFRLPANKLETLVLGNSQRSHVVRKRPKQTNTSLICHEHSNTFT